MGLNAESAKADITFSRGEEFIPTLFRRSVIAA